jgi:SAM-dependent methyltransferase
MTVTSPEVIKACCAAAYGVDLVRLFLGDSYHPGGTALTRRLAELTALQPGDRVLDVASGIGTSALLLARELGVEVVGVDLGEAQVAHARSRAECAGLADRVRFEVGDAERLPVSDARFDAVLCECAFCTFPDKAAAAAELARVVRRGGRIGLADVWLEPDRLDPDLRGLAGRVACLADARPIAEITAILESAGLTVICVERHDDALATTITQVIDRLRAVRIVGSNLLRGLDVSRAIEHARRAADAVECGHAGYALLAATKA